MKITHKYTKDECEAAVELYIKKFDAGTLTVEDDSTLFFQTLYGAIYKSRNEKDDEEKQELWENIEMDVEEFGKIGYFIEIRGTDLKWMLRVDPDDLNFCTYEGEHDMETDFLAGCNHKIWMDWVPSVQEKLLKGDPNMTAAFFAGDVKVNGSTKLGAKPRDWIYDLMAYIEREPKT